MPNNCDFKEVKNIQEKRLDIEGWISPLIIEYGTGFEGGVPSYFWRVKGTSHTFVIPILRMDFLSKGDYESHFIETLKTFRIDYIKWSSEGFYTDWMQEYHKMFQSFISI